MVRGRSGSGAVRVLLVQDGSSWQSGLAELVASSGAIALVARTTEDALRYVDDFAPDVILVELGSPGVDGLALGRELAGHQRRPELQVVAITTPALALARDAIGAAGFDFAATSATLQELEPLLRRA